jgi:hypothetical protein
MNLKSPWSSRSGASVAISLIIAVILVAAYVEGPRSVARGAFALGALALLGSMIAPRISRGHQRS